jgi:hypothetical protein
MMMGEFREQLLHCLEVMGDRNDGLEVAKSLRHEEKKGTDIGDGVRAVQPF